MDELLASIFRNQWLVLIIIGLLLLALGEIGFRTGLRLFVRKDEPRKGQIGGIQGAVLGLLALLLGFTFSMALLRYENRRDLVLKEANAIGTTYLRASFLPEPHANAVEDLLRRYTDARLNFYSAGNDSTKIAAAEEEAAKLQRELWAETVAAGKEAPTPITATFINALNETIDLDATRLHALRSRVPGAVWLLLLIVAGAGCFASGYGAGASGERTGFSDAMLPLLIAVVITIIADFDRPRHGLISISQQPLLDLKQSLQSRQ
jgi:FtsH-binding integral membrane protein